MAHLTRYAVLFAAGSRDMARRAVAPYQLVRLHAHVSGTGLEEANGKVRAAQPDCHRIGLIITNKGKLCRTSSTGSSLMSFERVESTRPGS